MAEWFKSSKGKSFLRSQEAHRKLCDRADKEGNRRLVSYHYGVWREQQALGRVLSKEERAKIFHQSKD